MTSRLAKGGGVVALGLLLLAGGCSFHARDAGAYRDATRALLQSKNDDIKACYDAALKENATVSGTVVIQFKVAAKTGKLTKLDVVNAETTAPKELARCVKRAIGGLVLSPADTREGKASFRWEFQVKS